MLVGIALGASARELDTWLCGTSMLSVHVFGDALAVAWRFPRTRKVWPHPLGATVLSLYPGALLLGIPSMVVLLTAEAIRRW